MAPFRSIIRYLFEGKTDRKVTFFFGVRARRDLYYAHEFGALAREYGNFRFIPALSAPARGDRWSGEVGFIHEVVDRGINSGENMEAYLCGPPSMIDATIRVLISKGVREEDILFDKL